MIRMMMIPAMALAATTAAGQSDLFGYSLYREVAGGSIERVAFVPGSSFVLVAMKNGSLRLDDLAGGASRSIAVSVGAVRALTVSRDGSRIAYGSEAGAIGVVDVSTGQGRQFRLDDAVTALGFSPMSDVLAAGTKKGKAVLLDASSGGELYQLPGSLKGPVRLVAYKGLNLIAVTGHGQVIEWDVKNRAILRQMQDTEGQVVCAAMNGAGSFLAIGSEYSRIAKGNPMRPAHPSDFYREHRIKLYDLENGLLAKQITGIDGQVQSLSISADGRFAAVTRQRQLQTYTSVFDLIRGTEVASWPAMSGTLTSEFSPNARWLAASTPEGTLRVYEVAGIQRSQSAQDLAGVRVRITSAETRPLLKFDVPTIIAILDLRAATGVDQQTATAVSEMLRNRVAGAPNLAIVERERVQQIMTEQIFQASDRVDSTTAVRLGRILGASKLVVGSVSKLESTYTINAQLLDVQTGRLDGVREVICQRCSADDLPLAVAELRSAMVDDVR